ncbi:MAG: rRNA maturation RNase YbeY [Actinomycetota bacterium]|nr:rRNA maturation RNase YbeY [Actinomycetota bacterium]
MAVFVADEQEHSVNGDRLRRLATYVLAAQRVPDAMELSVLCVDRTAIAQLNAHHMDSDGPTDVLAFPMDVPGETRPGEPAILGDVVVCPEVAAAQAPAHGTTTQGEIDLLVVHGILHLLGHDHAEPAQRDAMFGLTDRLLAGFSGADRVAP